MNSNNRIFTDSLTKEIIPTKRGDSYSLLETSKVPNTNRWGNGPNSNQLRTQYLTQGIGFKILNKYSSDLFNYWFKVHSDNEELIEAIKKINSPVPKFADEKEKTQYLNFKRVLKSAGTMAIKYGYSLLFLGVEEETGITNKDDLIITSSTKIRYLQPIPKKDVNRIKLEDGEIKGYNFTSKNGPNEINPNRVLHIKPFEDDNNVEGVPLLQPAYNYIESWEDFIWSVSKGFFRHGMGFPHKKIAADVWNTMSDDERESETNKMKNINSLTGFVGPDDEEILFPGANGTALNPVEYKNALLDAISMSVNMPKTILAGLQTGVVTGSETDQKEWANVVRGIQELVFSPIVYEFYGLLQKTGQLPKGTFEIEWESTLHDNETEKANIKKTDSETRMIELKSGLISKETQEMINSGELIQTEPLQTNPFSIGTDKIITLQRGVREEENTDSSDTCFLDIALSEFSTEQKPFIKNFINVEKIGTEYFKDLSKLLDFVVTNIEQSLISKRKIKKLTDAYSEEEIRTVLEEYRNVINKEMEGFTKKSIEIGDVRIKEGGLSTILGVGELIGIKGNINSQTNKELIGFLKDKNQQNLIQLSNDIKSSVMQQIENDLLSGSSERNIINNVKKYFTNTQITIPEKKVNGKVVRQGYTRTLTAKSRAQILARESMKYTYNEFSNNTYKEANLTKFQYLTAGDNRVRPTHAQMQGQVFNIGSRMYLAARDLTREIGCRCVIIPYLT